jgi:hypothetical protein
MTPAETAAERQALTPPWQVWTRPTCAAALERLPLIDRQRLIGACADLELSGAAPLSRPPGEPSPSGWAELQMSSGAGRWWWLVKGRDVCLRAAQSPSELPPWRDADPRAEGARPLKPLTRIIRSPEQAQVRRALLAREGAALHIDAPSGAGCTWGLALAAADLLSERAGEVLFVSRHPHLVSRLVREATPQVSPRLRALTPRDLLRALLDEGDGQAPPPAAEPPPLNHAARFRAWLQKQRALGGPWRSHPDLLYHIITARLWGRALSDPREADVWTGDLAGLPDEWRNAALAVEERARATPLYEDFARLSRLKRGAPWPWRRVEALMIDDCLDVPWVTLSAILSVAHAQMSERGERWTLVLAGRARETLGGGATSWEDLRVFCRGVLGRWPERLHLSRSERLTQERLNDLSALSRAYEDLPIELRPERLITPTGTHRPPSPPNHPQSPLLSAPLRPLKSAETRAQLRALLSALAGTPGGYLLDLTGGELAARLGAEAPLSEHERARLITLEALIGDSSLPLGDSGGARGVEPQTLAVWPRGAEVSAADTGASDTGASDTGALTLPEPLARLQEMITLNLWRALLSSTTGPVIWLGEPPRALSETLKDTSLTPITPEALCERLDQSSPWGGRWARRRVERAGALADADALAASLAVLREVEPVAALALGGEGGARLAGELKRLEGSAFSAALAARDWGVAAEIHATSGVTLTEAQGEGLRGLISEVIARGDEAMVRGDQDALTLALEPLRDLERLTPALPLYAPLGARLRAWSQSHLTRPVPQAPTQRLLLGVLARFSPESADYSALREAYELTTPTAPQLCERAETLLRAQLTRAHDEERARWSSLHLERWARHLTKTPLPTPAPTPLLALAFAVSAAQRERWDLASRLRALSALGAGELGEEGGRAWRLLVTQYDEARALQGLAERRAELRARGDLRALERTFVSAPPPLEAEPHAEAGAAEGPPAPSAPAPSAPAPSAPPELVAAWELLRALEGARGVWGLLTPAERETLEAAWRRAQTSTPHPRWDLTPPPPPPGGSHTP